MRGIYSVRSTGCCQYQRQRNFDHPHRSKRIYSKLKSSNGVPGTRPLSAADYVKSLTQGPAQAEDREEAIRRMRWAAETLMLCTQSKGDDHSDLSSIVPAISRIFHWVDDEPSADQDPKGLFAMTRQSDESTLQYFRSLDDTTFTAALKERSTDASLPLSDQHAAKAAHALMRYTQGNLNGPQWKIAGIAKQLGSVGTDKFTIGPDLERPMLVESEYYNTVVGGTLASRYQGMGTLFDDGDWAARHSTPKVLATDHRCEVM